MTPEFVDWAERWNTLVTSREAQARAREQARPDESYWDARSSRLTMLLTPADPDTDPVLQRIMKNVSTGETVVDVGAGGGRYAIPLSAVASRVIAVEPSAGMAGRLRANIEERNISNISVEESTWEQSAASGDHVVCSGVLTPIAEAAQFIRKLAGAARQSLVIVVRQSQMDARTHLATLWNLVYGEERVPEPTALDCLNLMHQLELSASLDLVEQSRTMLYATREDLRADLFQALMLPPNPEGDPATIVDAFLDERLEHRDDGVLLPAPPTVIGILTWRRSPSN